MKVRNLPEPPNGKRVESGAVAFGDDWPGVFVRGDVAAFLARDLERALRMLEPTLAGLVGQPIDPEQPERVWQAWEIFHFFRGPIASTAKLLAKCDLTRDDEKTGTVAP